MANPLANPWAPWGIIQTLRDGYPALAESSLWELSAKHPEVFDRASPTELYVHLDQPYRVVTLSDRSFRWLLPAPERRRSTGSGTGA